MPNACKSHAVASAAEWRTAEEHVDTCPGVGDNSAKALLIPHTVASAKKAARRSGRGLRPIRSLVW